MAAVSVTNRAERLKESARKIESPFMLDESLCLYSPQENVAALEHPRIREWIAFITTAYRPVLPKSRRRVLLFMPCTKTKPYPASTEHQSINQYLFDAGFVPVGSHALPDELLPLLLPGIGAHALNLSLLSDGKGTVIHRMVISEPLGIVPYEHIAEFAGKASPAAAYDDPGLFEHRGNAVSPWLSNNTAVQVSPTRWKWGDEERRHYVLMHNAMAETIAATIARIGELYTDRISWVSPGLTHRSFVVGREQRAAHQVVATRRVGERRLELVGANDLLPPALAIECLPTLDHCSEAVRRLAERLGVDVKRATGIYARGGVNATPLALPEMLAFLRERLHATLA